MIYYPHQYNYRSDKGSGGTNLRVMTPEQEKLLKIWENKNDSRLLALMLLNHTTLDEQTEFLRLYETFGNQDV